MLKMIRIATVVMLATLLVNHAGAADKPAQPAGEMPEWMKLAQPSDGHKTLDSLIGKWDHTVTWWMDDKSKPEVHKGTNENRWILGGRFIQQEATGETKNDQTMQFQGLGITGYDNVKKEYNSIWMDNMGTGMMSAAGQMDKKTNTIREEGEFACPMTGEKNRWFRANWKIIDKNNYTYEMFTKNKEGKEFKSLEVAYKRAK